MRYIVLIPVYNEEKTIRSVVEGVLTITKDVLVIDDGSSDSTLSKIESLDIPIIKQFHRGKGAAIRAGFGYAIERSYEWVITIDGDGQHDWREIPKFIDAMTNRTGDIIVGSRMTDTSTMPLLRLVINRVMSTIISRIVARRIPDSQCGFKAIKVEVLKDINLTTSNYDTESEILIKAGKRDYTILSIPIKTIYNGSDSGINKFTDTVRFLSLIRNSL